MSRAGREREREKEESVEMAERGKREMEKGTKRGGGGKRADGERGDEEREELVFFFSIHFLSFSLSSSGFLLLFLGLILI